MRTVAFCEIEPYCQEQLARIWPGVPIFADVRGLDAASLRARGIAPDVICGGFPCQDLSIAGAGAGIGGSRSGLWREYARLIGEIRPKFVIVENVAALLNRGLGIVLGDLAALGFDAEWHCIPASAVGAEHHRDRIWIVAYARETRLQGLHDARWGKHLQPASGDVWRHWSAEPAVARVANGVPRQLVADEIAAYGNAVVPQIPEIIGRAIMSIGRLSASERKE